MTSQYPRAEEMWDDLGELCPNLHLLDDVGLQRTRGEVRPMFIFADPVNADLVDLSRSEYSEWRGGAAWSSCILGMNFDRPAPVKIFIIYEFRLVAPMQVGLEVALPISVPDTRVLMQAANRADVLVAELPSTGKEAPTQFLLPNGPMLSPVDRYANGGRLDAQAWTDAVEAEMEARPRAVHFRPIR